MNSKSGEARDAYCFILPLIFFIFCFIVFPVLGTLFSSLFRDVAFLPKKFLGISNYERLLIDKHFWESLRFTLLFTCTSVSIELLIGMAFALLLNEKFRFRGLLRASVLIPWAIPIAISARVWQLIYNYDYGFLNFLITRFFHPVNFLGSAVGAFASLVIADVWKTTPFMVIILLAGLQTIPKKVYEQSMVDGANFRQRFFQITLPLLKPAVVVALLFRTIDALRVFDLIYVLTGGGPGGSTTSVSLYGYKFFLMGDFGYGSSISTFIFLIAFLLSLFYIKLGEFRERLG
jgi:multiple sugar transport system permease protein